jgi:putative spermidine/putrescine transport system permease protein
MSSVSITDRGNIGHPGFLLPLSAAALLLAGFLALPFLSMIRMSFTQPETRGFAGFGNFAYTLTRPYYYRAFANSLAVSLFSCVSGLAFGALAAAALNVLPRPIKEKLLLVASVSSNFAGVPLAFGYIVLLGANGMFTILFQRLGLPGLRSFDLYSWAGLGLVYVYFQVPLCALLLLPAFEALRKEWKEASAILGASAPAYWGHIALPALAPALAGTGGILFANALGAYATAYALVGSNFSLVPIRIGSLVASNVNLQPELGAALAVMLTLLMGLSIGLNQGMQALWRRFTK